jgi:hypothetical protein
MMKTIDCDTYLVLASSGHPCEPTTHARDYAVGLSAARRLARELQKKHPEARVEIFLCDGTSRIIANGMPA